MSDKSTNNEIEESKKRIRQFIKKESKAHGFVSISNVSKFKTRNGLYLGLGTDTIDFLTSLRTLGVIKINDRNEISVLQ